MKAARRRLLRDAGALGMLGALAPAWARNACGPTGAATEGPFYVAHASEGSDIHPARAPGPPMRIAGTVPAEDGGTPPAPARVGPSPAGGPGPYHPNRPG